jgi:hypothetical protein
LLKSFFADPPESLKIAEPALSADVPSESESTTASEPSTPPSSTAATTGNIQPNPLSSPEWPIFQKHDDTVQKGLEFFRAKNSNVINFRQEPNAAWEPTFRGSHVLSWKGEQAHRGAVNLFLIGHLFKSDLATAVSDYEAGYRLELVLERDALTALQSILNNGPLKDATDPYSPLKGRMVTFSLKLKALQKSEAPDIEIHDPFPFLFDGREIAKDRRTLLKNYPVDKLSSNNVLAVETNISTWTISARGDFPERAGYSLSLRSIYFLGEGSIQSSPKTLKRQGDSLVSPRKNKKAGQLAVFSDND